MIIPNLSMVTPKWWVWWRVRYINVAFIANEWIALFKHIFHMQFSVCVCAWPQCYQTANTQVHSSVKIVWKFFCYFLSFFCMSKKLHKNNTNKLFTFPLTFYFYPRVIFAPFSILSTPCCLKLQKNMPNLSLKTMKLASDLDIFFCNIF